MGTYPDPRSVLILDNWAGHRNATFLNFCFDLNIMVEYGVPYAPDIMVHEPCGGSGAGQQQALRSLSSSACLCAAASPGGGHSLTLPAGRVVDSSNSG